MSNNVHHETIFHITWHQNLTSHRFIYIKTSNIKEQFYCFPIGQLRLIDWHFKYNTKLYESTHYTAPNQYPLSSFTYLFIILIYHLMTRFEPFTNLFISTLHWQAILNPWFSARWPFHYIKSDYHCRKWEWIFFQAREACWGCLHVAPRVEPHFGPVAKFLIGDFSGGSGYEILQWLHTIFISHK